MDIIKDSLTDEWYFSSNAYILSETDEKGIIIYANNIFCEVAGYTLEELIGEPHNMVRHPDMPRIAFKGLWDDIKSKGFWTGIVKNRRKDGGFYWVNATVLRMIHDGGRITYLSVRRKPDRAQVDACSVLYADLKASQ
ncbi:MAG: PAS sensor domain-containing protein [Sulfurimonas sp.]|nr:MAG: PAS sensor domain-containing protein [Sulfurimonas sp.]